ncbi:TAXI family TRAP transporter solute-binding subunit [Roseomonas sp. AR75]|uniref:TAXI family TRAP transporter solute-binding subunit n=1 Tax=Roseomonas sp. AR75 TaxID=2562311 RepID=UPI0010C08426|nr:TAXI family TRAP transporter solute-binding subunit [Roseomonas sp. AR75]
MTRQPPGALARRSLLLSALASGLAAPALAQPAMAQALSRRTAEANAGTVGVIAGGVDGTYIRIAADLSAVLDDGNDLRVIAMLGKGSLQNISDIVLLRGVDVGIVQSDALAFARRRRLIPGAEGLIQYIAKLYDEEIHVLARPGINSVQDLAGQVVNVDVVGSGTAMTASLVFEALGIEVRTANDVQDLALTKLQRGEIAAIVFVAGKPARLFAGVQPGSELRFLPLPATPALMETYLPATLSAADYPALIPQGASVETIAVGAVMAVYAWQPGSERHRKVARFVEALHANFESFLRPPRHPKWREVNLAAQVPGWVRFDHTAGQGRGRRRDG